LSRTGFELLEASLESVMVAAPGAASLTKKVRPGKIPNADVCLAAFACRHKAGRRHHASKKLQIKPSGKALLRF
jgi:hypothetical protein